MTLSELAVDGSLDEANSKYACVVPAIDLLEACEVIECTKAGQESVYGVKVWTK